MPIGVLGTQRYDGTVGQLHVVTDGDTVYISPPNATVRRPATSLCILGPAAPFPSVTIAAPRVETNIAGVTAGILATDDDLAAMNRVLIPTSTTFPAPPTSLAGKPAS